MSSHYESEYAARAIIHQMKADIAAAVEDQIKDISKKAIDAALDGLEIRVENHISASSLGYHVRVLVEDRRKNNE